MNIFVGNLASAFTDGYLPTETRKLRAYVLANINIPRKSILLVMEQDSSLLRTTNVSPQALLLQEISMSCFAWQIPAVQTPGKTSMIQTPLARWSRFFRGSIGNSLAARAVANRLGGWRVPGDSLPFGWSKSFSSARGEARESPQL